ncbi:MAG: hypothetical protein HOY76_21410 [Streptomyces sp.]|nr:hypothetical protein [Streptomyces sp.]
MTAATRTRRNTLRTAARTAKALNYRTLSGPIAALVDTGRLIRTGDFLQRIGGHDLKDGEQSWFGRHVAKAYRAATGTEPLRVWAQHRTTGKWIHVMVYGPMDPALYTGLRSYKGTRHLLPALFTEAA